MKVHYINILLFALPLNIMVYTPQQKPHNTPHHTPKIPTTRLLCECELYSPANYDNDPQMKEVMDNFNKQTQQRFHEYVDRMKTTRQKCKEQCDKVSQKIILKDKLEKELMDKFATLHTDIQSDAIPTCVCEESLADKVEKGCLRCGGILGAAMPELGSIGGSLLSALYAWKPKALEAAIVAAEEFGAAQGAVAGKAAGMNLVIRFLKQWGIQQYCPQIFKQIKKIEHFTELKDFVVPIINKHGDICASTANKAACDAFDMKLGAGIPGVRDGPPPNAVIKTLLEGLAEKAETTADGAGKIATKDAAAAFETAQKGAIETTFMGNQTIIISSIVAIVVIVLIMVIIYLILRYRRKKKMKKKLQYIKLLEE
ncbi:rifin PIR protein, putative [Plasmodium reichenowi]|uniref:Rifin PIR protein, putative n=1 Tax=Plasmodium reichenowi TaxID=5854 RepID=A0A2P9DS97_PLARE|nr:rifin PIR protein, putative [Plasmodium reichenowi]